MALYCSGRTTGIVLDIGDGVTHSVPIFDGKYGAREFYLNSFDRKRGFNFVTGAEVDIVRRIKEEYGYIALNVEKEAALPELPIERKFELPDGQIITIGEFVCLFVAKPYRPPTRVCGNYINIWDSRTENNDRSIVYSRTFERVRSSS
eukprot:sb/3473719/